MLRPARRSWLAPGKGAHAGGGNCTDPLHTVRVVLTAARSLSGWSKTSHPSEAPEDDGWSSAEELINSSDAEEEGRVGPRKLVTLGPTGRSAWPCWPLGGRASEHDLTSAPHLWLLRAHVRCQGPLGLCARPPPSSDQPVSEGTVHTPDLPSK